MPYRPLFVVLLLAGALVSPRSGAAQASARLQLLDPVHRDLDRLAAWGLIDTILVGQRPYSRAQAARMTAQALRGRARLTPESPLGPTADRALARLTDRLAPELDQLGVLTDGRRFPLLVEARADATWTDSPTRDVPSNEVGAIAARINPLLAYDQGRAMGDGATIGVELDVAGRLGSRIAGSARGRAQRAMPMEGDSETSVALAAGSARLLLGNLALTLGRDHVVWGQAPQGGVVLSSNAGALLLASLESEFPFVLPGPLDALGPTRVQLFLADLGTEAQRYAHSQLFGARASFLPSPRVEVGVEFLVESGGEGAPESSLKDRILDYLFFPDLFMSRELQASNKVAGLDARVRVPEARGLELWAELAIDDIDIDRFRSMIWEDGSWSVGARLQRLSADGTLALRIEGQHTGIRMYEHNDFRSGLTLEQRLLGSELGPNANGATVALEWESDEASFVTLEGAVERRSSDPYMLVQGTPYYFTRLGIEPKEMRWRARAAWERFATSSGWGLRLEGGYERADNFASAAARTEHNLFARTVIVARLP